MSRSGAIFLKLALMVVSVIMQESVNVTFSITWHCIRPVQTGLIITFRVSGRGYKNGAARVCPCVSIQILRMCLHEITKYVREHKQVWHVGGAATL